MSILKNMENKLDELLDRHWWINILLLILAGLLIWAIVVMNEYLKTLL